MDQPYLKELVAIRPGNDLYARWVKYGLTLSEQDIELIIDNGLIHQAQALESMMKEIVAGGAMPPSLARKLRLIVIATQEKANGIR